MSCSQPCWHLLAGLPCFERAPLLARPSLPRRGGAMQCLQPREGVRRSDATMVCRRKGFGAQQQLALPTGCQGQQRLGA